MFQTEQQALDYIDENTQTLLDGLQDGEIKTICTVENTRINIMRDKKQLLKVINRYTGEKKLLDICREIIDLKNL